MDLQDGADTTKASLQQTTAGKSPLVADSLDMFEKCERTLQWN